MTTNKVNEREDDMWLKWIEAAPLIYDEIYYKTNPIVSYINRSGHSRLEKAFSPDDHFERVIEVGAGTGEHLAFVRHRYDTYYLTDVLEGHLERSGEKYAGNARVICEHQDALNLSFPDRTFDRLISVYNLEHLPSPHLALKEWRRVVKESGVISIAIPLEGGIAWNTGRHFTTRRYFARKGLNLDYIIAREHINASYRLISLIRHYFSKRTETWFPFGLPLYHINLVYTCTIRNL